jgi:hypothetical protein
MIKMLNYKNDSLLLNKETVNDLIRKKNDHLIFLDENKLFLNLYSALVKKTDFTDVNKIVQPLQKTIYVKVNDNLAKIILSKCKNKKECKKLIEAYTGKRSNCDKAIIRWHQNKVYPLILLRILSRNEKELIKFIQEVQYFTDFLNKSRFYCPKTLKHLLNPKLIYFVGCSAGDGHIDKKGKRWVLVDGSSNQKRLVLSGEFVSSLKSLMEMFVGTTYINKYETKYELGTNNKPFCRFLNFFFGLPYGAKKKTTLQSPLVLKYSKNDLNKYFWRGLFDTDGSAVSNYSVGFGSIDKKLLRECEEYLKSIRIISTKTRTSVNISMPDLKKWAYIGFAHPRKQIEFISTLQNGATFKSVKIKEGKEMDERLKIINKVIRTDFEGYRIRVNSVALKKERIDLKFVQQTMKALFGYEFKKASNNLYYFKSKKVYEYLRSLFIYEPAWKAISEEEENQLLHDWNDVWKK